MPFAADFLEAVAVSTAIISLDSIIVREQLYYLQVFADFSIVYMRASEDWVLLRLGYLSLRSA